MHHEHHDCNTCYKSSRHLEHQDCHEHMSKNWNFKFWLIVKTWNPSTLSWWTENGKDKKVKYDTHSLIFLQRVAKPSNNMLRHLSSSCSQKWCNLHMEAAQLNKLLQQQSLKAILYKWCFVRIQYFSLQKVFAMAWFLFFTNVWWLSNKVDKINTVYIFPMIWDLQSLTDSSQSCSCYGKANQTVFNIFSST
jgi:hypothetical protein